MSNNAPVPALEEQVAASEEVSNLLNSPKDPIATVNDIGATPFENILVSPQEVVVDLKEEHEKDLHNSNDQIAEQDETIPEGELVSAIRDTDIAAESSISDITQNGPTELQRLRDLVFASRGTKASLPTGWDNNKDEEKYEPPVKEAENISMQAEATDEAAQKMLQRAIDLVGQLASDSDTDTESDSESASGSDASTSTSSHNSATKRSQQGKMGKIVVTETLSDDEEEGGRVGAMGPVTKNEVLEPTVDVPPFSIVPESQEIRPLGKIHSIVDCVVVVAQDVGMAPGSKPNPNGSMPARAAPVDRYGKKGEEEGEYSVLDTGSLLSFQDRHVLGVVYETFGSVLSPLYALRYTSAAHVNRDLIQIGKPVYYVPSNSTYVLTRSLRALGKGSDASNLWDEEIGDDEREFSDDEAEAAYKRNTKAAKGKGKKRGNTEDQQIGRPKHHLPMRPMATPPVHRDASINHQSQALSYDDEDSSIPHQLPYQQPVQTSYQQSAPPQSAYAQWLYQQQQQRQQYAPSNGMQGQPQAFPTSYSGPSAAMSLLPHHNSTINNDSYDPQQPHFAYPPSQPPPRWR